MKTESVFEENESILEAAREATLNLLPSKSKEKYDKTFEQFCQWRNKQGVQGITENIMLAFFLEKSKNLKASSLWSTYSMLKSTLQIYEGSDISKYKQLISFLKKKNEGYEPKKSKILTFEQIMKFLNDASDESHLFLKVALIFALNGAMQGEELRSLTLNDIEENESIIIVTLRNTKTKKKRVFTITSEANGIELYRKYRKLRPQNTGHSRFFVCYRNGKCTVQPVGINTFYGLPKKIAEYLKLPDSTSYTGHCMRRSSATLLVDNGGSIPDLKRLGGWASTSSAEGYIGESIQNKIQTSKKIFRGLNQQDISKNDPQQHSSSPSLKMMDVSLNEFSKSTLNGISFQNISNCTFNFYGNKNSE